MYARFRPDSVLGASFDLQVRVPGSESTPLLFYTGIAHKTENQAPPNSIFLIMIILNALHSEYMHMAHSSCT